MSEAIPTCSCHRALRLRPETIARLRAAAGIMGIDVEALLDRIVLESLPTIEHEDLLPEVRP